MEEYTTKDGRVLDMTTPEGLRALRVEIAKRLGWRVERRQPDWSAEDVQYVVLLDPEGKDREWESLYSDEVEENDLTRAEGELWIEAMYIDYEECDATLPDWPADANAALGLVTGEAFALDFYNGNGFWSAAIGTNPGGAFDGAPTPALAICLAWLAYKDAEATP